MRYRRKTVKLKGDGSGGEDEHQKSDEKEAGDAPAPQRGGRRGGAGRGGYRGRGQQPGMDFYFFCLYL